jgi:hypothetical protein
MCCWPITLYLCSDHQKWHRTAFLAVHGQQLDVPKVGSRHKRRLAAVRGNKHEVWSGEQFCAFEVFTGLLRSIHSLCLQFQALGCYTDAIAVESASVKCAHKWWTCMCTTSPGHTLDMHELALANTTPPLYHTCICKCFVHALRSSAVKTKRQLNDEHVCTNCMCTESPQKNVCSAFARYSCNEINYTLLSSYQVEEELFVIAFLV